MRVSRPNFWRAVICVYLVAFSLCGCGGGSGSGSTPTPPTNSNIAPTLASVTPPSAVAGSAAITITATGANFVSGSVIDWNGSPLASTFVSATQLTATVPASDLTTSGTAKLTVVTPAPGGGSSSPINFAINPAANPTPAITSLAPAQFTAGGSALTLTVAGTGFLSSSQILWNGTPRTTSFQSATTLTAQIAAADVATAGTATVAVSNLAPGGGSSNVLNFAIEGPASNVSSNLTAIDIIANDLVWSPQQKKLYLSVPSSGAATTNTIAVVDPIAGQIVTSASTTSAPNRLAISDDGQFLYAALNSESAIARYKLPSLAPDIEWPVGADSSDPNGPPLIAADMRVQPGAAHTLAVLRGGFSAITPIGSDVAVFDDATIRPAFVDVIGPSANAIEWKADGSALFGQDALSSERALYTFAVNSTGVTISNTYGGAFRQSGIHLHSDAQTGYLYSDNGEVVDPSTGLPRGNYPYAPTTRSGLVTPTLTVVDPTLGRVFLLTSMLDLNSNLEWLIRSYDQKEFRLLGSIVIPGVVGVPANFVRWGNSGLAFFTNNAGLGGPAPIGKLYIIDGAIVNPAGPADGSSGSALNALPTLTTLSTASASAGSSDLIIQLSGRDFDKQAVVQWNATTIPSTWISATQMQATIPALNLSVSNQSNITVVNPAPGGGNSARLPFTVVAAPSTGNAVHVYAAGGNDVVWDSQRQKLYVSSPGIQFDLANKIVTVDPVAGTVTASAFAGSDPAKLSISSDNQFIYAGINGEASVRRFTLPNMTPDVSFTLGSDSFDGPFHADDLKAAPGSPHTVAVSKAEFDVSPASTGITIFDDATPRSVSAPGWNTGANAYAAIEWGIDASAIYAPAALFPTDFYILSVDGNGIRVNKDFPDALLYSTSDFDIHFDKSTGLLYTDGGQIVRPADVTVVGTFGASGLVATDSTLNRVFFLGQTPAQSGDFSDFTIESFNQTTFAPVDSITISHVVGTPTALVRWGTNGLAFVTRVGGITDTFSTAPGLLYVISGSFVNSSEPATQNAKPAPTSHVRMTWKR